MQRSLVRHRASGWLLLAGALALFAAGSGCDSDDVTAPPPPPPPASPEALLARLGEVYSARDYAGFAALFHQDGLGVDYAFIVNEPDPWSGDRHWDVTTELALHRRMFDPMHPLRGEGQVPRDYWPQNIRMTLTLIQPFHERSDLGLAPQWKAWECEFRTQGLWDLEGPTDFWMDARSALIVLEDTSLPAGSHGKFLLYRWADLGAFPRGPASMPAEAPLTWSTMKSLYRA